MLQGALLNPVEECEGQLVEHRRVLHVRVVADMFDEVMLCVDEFGSEAFGRETTVRYVATADDDKCRRRDRRQPFDGIGGLEGAGVLNVWGASPNSR